MKHPTILALAAAAIMAATTAASAQPAFTTNDVNLRAGPGNRYPLVMTLPEDTRVYIHGCLSNWDWCDVSWRYVRGWVFSDNLEAVWHNRRIGFEDYRSYVDIPYVTFNFGYWDRYYHDRPWFDSWDRWGDRNDRRWRAYRHGGQGDAYSNDNRYENDYGNNNNDYGNNADRTVQRRHRYEDNNAGTDMGDNTDRTVRHHRRYEDTTPGMRCGTADADPSCPDTSHGRQMQQQMDNNQ